MATKSHFSMVLRLASGIFFKKIIVTYNVEATIFTDIMIHNSNTVISDDMTACLELCHCAFEADYQPMTQKVIQLIHPYNIISKPQIHTTVLLCFIFLIISTTLCDSLSTHCPNLTHFDVSHNKLGTPGAQAIGSELHHINKQEKGFSLILSDAELHDEGVSAFVSYLHHSCCLNCLIMSSNNISDEGASYLLGRISVSYCHNIMLWKLDLSNNPLDFEHILSLITASSCSIGTLSLCKCWLTEYRPMRHQPMTPQTNTIQFLNLDENLFCKENIQILAKITNSCPNLEALSCCQCGITSANLRYLLSQLSFSFFRQLQAWWLSDNEIDDSGISALIDYLSSFSLSCSFGIDGNPVSYEMQEKFYNAGISCTIRKMKDLNMKC